MLTGFRALLNTDPASLAREALGLAAVVAMILAGLFLPGLG